MRIPVSKRLFSAAAAAVLSMCLLAAPSCAPSSAGGTSSQEAYSSVIASLESSRPDGPSSGNVSSDISSSGDVSSNVSSSGDVSSDVFSSGNDPSDTPSGGASSDGEPVAASEPCPVIIIPGILGTELISGSRTVWPLEIDTSASGLIGLLTDFLSLKLDGNGNTVSNMQPVRFSPMTEYQSGDDVGAYGAYTALALALSEDLGYENVWFFGYDWRLDNRETAEELYDYIQRVLSATEASKVNIVAHSMGGLVTSAYLVSHGGEGLIDRAVTCGTPFLGAQMAYTALEDGSGLIDVGSDKYQQFADMLPNVFSSFPSLYQLLPAGSWKALGLVDENGVLCESATFAQKAGYAFYTDVSCSLEEVWSSVDHTNIIGTGNVTAGENGDEDGDGTVTFHSASADGLFDENPGYTRITFELSHRDLVSDEAALDAILGAVGSDSYPG